MALYVSSTAKLVISPFCRKMITKVFHVEMELFAANHAATALDQLCSRAVNKDDVLKNTIEDMLSHLMEPLSHHAKFCHWFTKTVALASVVSFEIVDALQHKQYRM